MLTDTLVRLLRLSFPRRGHLQQRSLEALGCRRKKVEPSFIFFFDVRPPPGQQNYQATQ